MIAATDHPGFLSCVCGGLFAVAVGVAIVENPEAQTVDFSGPLVLKCLDCARICPLELVERTRWSTAQRQRARQARRAPSRRAKRR